MALSNFDRYFLNLPPLDRKDDFDRFWENSLAEIKKTPLESVMKKNSSRSTHRFNCHDVTYRGFTKRTVRGELFIPRTRMKPRAIIHIHDYNRNFKVNHQHLDDGAAYLFITLRGHEDLTVSTEEEPRSPGYMIENILDRDTYYAKAVYLDVYRSIDMLRLISDINCSSIGIMGKGFGAAAAIFTAVYSKRVSALVLDTPSFCHLPMSQNESTGDAATEINDFISERKNKKKQVKDNLTYFDAINFADKITVPVMTTVAFKDTISPPGCVFGLFNHFKCEKIIEVYPEEGNSAGGQEQFKKSLEWLIDKISG